MKHINIKKIGILFTLIFSFLFCLIPTSTKVSASTVVNQDYVKLNSMTREENTINFTTDNVYTVDSITYEITTYGNDDLIYADLITDAKVNKITDYMYSFEVSDEVIGVKIWKVKYQVSTNYYKNKMTTGENVVGNVNAQHRKNYVEVVADELWTSQTKTCEADFFESETCKKYYVFYFNLDTEIDWIVDLSLEYSVKTIEKKNWFANETETFRSNEIKLDHTTTVVDIVRGEEYLNDYVTAHNGWGNMNPIELFEYIETNYRRPVLGKNDNGNGYDWYVQPLIDEKLIEEDYALNWGYKREYLQEVAIIKMSYYSNGEYFADIPVLDEDTGWLDIVKDSKWYDNVNWINVLLVICLISLCSIFINWILRLFKLDKDSRSERRYKREIRKLREEEIEMMKEKRSKYNVSLNSNNRYRKTKRYKK